MNTFLPYPDFDESAECLDNKRLGKQRVEVLQLLKALLNPGTSKHENHPCAKMWRSYEPCLALYGVAICDEWRRRGYKDTVYDSILALFPESEVDGHIPKPPWMGNKEFHLSQQSNLLRKDKEHYGKFGWKVPDDLPYLWPVSEDSGEKPTEAGEQEV